MTRHGRYQQAVHRTFGGFEQIGRLGRIEPLPTGCERKLVMEGRSKTKEPLHGLAERQAERDGRPAILGRRPGRGFEVVSRRPGLRRIEILEEDGCEDLATLAKEDALRVGQR